VFQEEVDDFVKEHASEFAVLCMDGARSILVWVGDVQTMALKWFGKTKIG
jgi:hypothetical protein